MDSGWHGWILIHKDIRLVDKQKDAFRYVSLVTPLEEIDRCGFDVDIRKGLTTVVSVQEFNSVFI